MKTLTIILLIFITACNASRYNVTTPGRLLVKDAQDSVLLDTIVKGRIMVCKRYLKPGATISLGNKKDTIF